MYDKVEKESWNYIHSVFFQDYSNNYVEDFLIQNQKERTVRL